MQPSRPAFPSFMTLLVAAFAATAPPLATAADEWPPTKYQSRIAELEPIGRPADIFRHGVRKEWGYAAPQQDTFIVVHPKAEHERAPLYVVLHSAGRRSELGDHRKEETDVVELPHHRTA